MKKHIVFLTLTVLLIQLAGSSTSVPNFEPLQTYLQPAPIGVDMYYAWNCIGGRGKNVRVLDFELGWNRDHKEFQKPFIDNGPKKITEHGTLVWGIINAKNDGQGVTGMASDSEVGLWAAISSPDYLTIRKNIQKRLLELWNKKILIAGDILLIELQSATTDPLNRLAIEYWDPVFKLLKKFTDKGIVVIEAAGNGNRNLDDSLYKGKFKTRDSGAILVASGSAPVPKSKYKKHFVKHISSNYGSRIDTFNYGERVVSTGYGDLYLSEDETQDYHDDFGGTSSASAITAGLVASLMGIAKAQERILSPNEIRSALRETGLSPHPSEKRHIGSYPNMKQLIKFLELESGCPQ